MSLTISSTSFQNGGPIPAEHTCDGDDRSPPLAWTGAPGATQSFALIVDDPDCPDPAAPKRVWVHWVVYDIPRDTARLETGASPGGLPRGSREGRNDGGETSYHGPCPPIGRHRYYHRLYALDKMLGNLADDSKAGVLQAMEGHVLAFAEVMGTYER